jgi:hypothetical protein
MRFFSLTYLGTFILACVILKLREIFYSFFHFGGKFSVKNTYFVRKPKLNRKVLIMEKDHSGEKLLIAFPLPGV